MGTIAQLVALDSALFLVETMLVYGIHNFEYQRIAKITVMERRAFSRVTKINISGEMVN